MGCVAPLRVEDLTVKLQSSVLVVPSSACTANGSLFLSNIDQQVFFGVEQVFFYQFGPSGVAEIIRRALAEVLLHYYFAAGRFKFNEEESRLELECYSAGVLFASAQSQQSILELGDLTDPNPVFSKLILYPHNVNSIPDIPPVTVQVTKFSCGGFAIGFYVCHTLFDGLSGCNFHHNIASVAQGKGMQSFPKPERTQLRAHSPPCPTLQHPEIIPIPPSPAYHMFNSSYKENTYNNTLVFKTFSVNSSFLDRLKKNAMADGHIASCTSFEALVAHIWQARTRSMDMDPHKPSKLFLVGNIRHKVNPPLPIHFCGNGVAAPGLVDVKSTDVVQNSLSFCLMKVKEILACLQEDYVTSVVDYCELTRGISDVLGGLIITTWVKIPFHELDFGWGKPLYVAPVANNRQEYVLLVSSCKENGGINVFAGLEPDQMEKFRHYFWNVQG